mmetsp:Transcript_2614/g.8398  ORF Transcript_2614/g.8398 Transcript_2614/m.8398 type:complete len:120 (+) Transcript_2614:482-841(+)
MASHVGDAPVLGGVAKPIWFTDAVWPIADAEMQRPPRDCLRVAGAPRDIAQNASPRAAFPESAEAPMNAGFAETGAAVERVARAGATAERVAITADIVTLHATCVRVRGAKQARARVRS